MQGIATATGLQKSFSWAGVAAAGVSAQVGDFVGGGDGFTGTLVRGGASAIANAATRTALDNRTQFGDNLRASIPDVIGQALWAGATASGPAAQVENNPGDGGAGPNGSTTYRRADGRVFSAAVYIDDTRSVADITGYDIDSMLANQAYWSGVTGGLRQATRASIARQSYTAGFLAA